MSLRNEIIGHYRTVLSYINERNSPETNRVLLREIIEANPKLIKNALDVVYSSRIAKTTLASTSQCFYSIPAKGGTGQYLVMRGYCDCPYFAEHVLSRATAFTCKHELACILLEYMAEDIDRGDDALLDCVEDLEEDEFLERVHLVYDE